MTRRYIFNMARIRFHIIILLFLVEAAKVSAQTFMLHGKVTDMMLNPIEMATVSVAEQGKAVMTNLRGEFSMTLRSADSVVVRFSMIGYKGKTRVLRHPKGRLSLQVQLLDDSQLDGVTITERKRQTTQTQELELRDTQGAPSTTGNTVEEMVQQQAGVSTHSELSAQYNVRGGSFDENSVYLNNVELYRPFLVRSGQQEGLSVINADMVDRVQFSAGGFDAMYGDRMSSVLSINYRRPERLEAHASASLLGESAYVGYGNKRFSWSNGVRYKTNRYLLGSLETNGEYRPNYLDYQTYLTFRPDECWSIELIGDIADNHYNFNPQDRETKFGTLEDVKSFRVYFDGQERDVFRTCFGAFTIGHRVGGSTWLRLTAAAFHTDEQERYDIQGQYWLTQTETSDNLGVGTYMEHARNYLKATVKSAQLSLQRKTRHHDVRTAFTYKWEHITERRSEYEMRDSSGYSIPHTGTDLRMVYSLKAVNTLRANRQEAYLQDTYRFSSNGGNTLYTLCYGLRFSHWSFNDESILSPRLSLGIIPAFNQNVTLRFAAGLYYQSPFFKELLDTVTVDGTVRATLNSKVESQRSAHFIAGFDYGFRMSGRLFRFTAEAYYKALGRIVPYSVNNVKIVYDADRRYNGHSMGIDLKLYGEFVPDADSWITLSLMDTKINVDGQKVPLPTDQRYAVNLYFTDYFPGTDRWRMSLKLAYADGLPFGVPHRGVENQRFRAPAYKRVDIGMNYRLCSREHSANRFGLHNLWLGVDCLNLFGINNVNSYYWITDVSSQQYAVPNYLTGRMINVKVVVEF